MTLIPASSSVLICSSDTTRLARLHLSRLTLSVGFTLALLIKYLLSFSKYISPMKRIALILFCLLPPTWSWSQNVFVGLKGGYCGYLAIDKTPFYQTRPNEGYSGRFCGEVFTRIENKSGFFIEFGLTRLSNKYDTWFPSDHEPLPYKSSQQLYLVNASFQLKLHCRSVKHLYGYVGPSFSIGFADIKENYSDRFLGIALVPGLSQGVIYDVNSKLKVVAALDGRYLMLYNESSGGIGFKFDRNTLLMGQIGLSYTVN